MIHFDVWPRPVRHRSCFIADGEIEMRRYLAALALSGALLLPAGLRADHKERDRYYHRESKDWHAWNERESKAYKEYLKAERKLEKEWRKANRREQENYWRWRH